MTSSHSDLAVSRLELIVLARLSDTKPPGEAALGEAVRSLVRPDQPAAGATQSAINAFEALRQRGLAAFTRTTRAAKPGTTPKRTPTKEPTSMPSSSSAGQRGRRTLTPAGARALAAAFKLAEAPAWAAVRNSHLAACALDLPAGAAATTHVLTDSPRLVTAVLAQRTGSTAATLVALCDQLVAAAVGLTEPPFTSARIRAHVLARELRIASPAELGKLAHRVGVPNLKASSLGRFAARAAMAAVGARDARRPTLIHGLARRWCYHVTDPSTLGVLPVSGVSTGPTTAAMASAPMQASRAAAATSATAETPPIAATTTAKAPPSTATAAKIPPTSAPQPGSALGHDLTPALLLSAVRDALPRIGSDGRYGDEKVFVSAIWHTLEADHRLRALSIERFKRWLVAANRDGDLRLARADLVGAMNPKLVAESEISDQGATFHFVLDRRTVTPVLGGAHARQ